MRTVFVLAVCIAAASAMYDSWESIPVDEVKQSAPDADFAHESTEALLQEAKHLGLVSAKHTALSLHADRIAKHAKLLQTASGKAKAYAHNFNNSKNAIRSALKALTGQLNAGHRHDVNALRSERHRGNTVINGAHNGGKNKVAGFRNKACPTKREESEARAKRDAAHKAANGLGHGKICSGGLSTTYGDMDIEKATPKFGTELRNKWDKARSKYQSSLGKYKAAKKVHSDALKKYNVAMAQFRTALNIEVSNAVRACKNAHHEYNALKKEVASNVNSRKNVFISTLIITCYVDNITSNHSAKVCADKKRRSSTTQWNINGHSLNHCASKAHLANSFGPSGWTPSTRTCHHTHWNKGKGAGPSKTVVSNGSKKYPHCTWNSKCKWDSATKGKCATGLCKSAGYKGGKYVAASNDMCKKSFTSSTHWFYIVDKAPHLRHVSHSNDAQITAKCHH